MTKKFRRVLVNFLGFEILEHPPYSPDLAPMDLRVFPEIQGKCQACSFRTPPSFVFIHKILFRYTPVTGLAISMLNGYRDVENAFQFIVITFCHDFICCTLACSGYAILCYCYWLLFLYY